MGKVFELGKSSNNIYDNSWVAQNSGVINDWAINIQASKQTITKTMVQTADYVLIYNNTKELYLFKLYAGDTTNHYMAHLDSIKLMNGAENYAVGLYVVYITFKNDNTISINISYGGEGWYYNGVEQTDAAHQEYYNQWMIDNNNYLTNQITITAYRYV